MYLAFKKEQIAERGQNQAHYDALSYALAPVREAMGYIHAEALTRLQCREYYKAQLTRTLKRGKKEIPISAGTVGKQMGILAAALNYAHRERLIAKPVVVERPASPPPRDKWATPTQIKHFMATIETPHVKTFAMIAQHTLSRSGAILELKWEQIDMKRRLIDFNHGQFRTKKRRVPVPINDILLAELQQAWELRSTEWVIEYGGRPVSSIKKAFRQWAKESGLPWLTPHVLRHTGATLMAQAGVSMWDIAGIMGDTVNTVQKHYAKHSPEYLKSAATALERIYA